jgi:hypothetical protein
MVDKKPKPRMIALEPATMSVPAMDRPSLALAWFMDSIRFDVDSGGDFPVVTMECTLCGGVICHLDDGDTLRTMFNTALAHGC